MYYYEILMLSDVEFSLFTVVLKFYMLQFGFTPIHRENIIRKRSFVSHLRCMDNLFHQASKAFTNMFKLIDTSRFQVIRMQNFLN